MRHEFEIFKKEVEVETKAGKKTYVLLPLRGRYYPKFISVAGRFSNLKEDATPQEVMSVLDENTIETLHSLVYETLKVSMKVDKNEEEELDYFVSQNLFSFIKPLIEVNTASISEEE